MKIIATVEEMGRAVREERRRGRSISLVPTMGFLHEGHLSLVRLSRAAADITVVSLFVNPTQFGPKEDLNTYPRDFERDAAMLRAEGADYLFAPAAEDMYASEHRTFVEVRDLQDKLCGRSRPGHFRGVCTIVLKLFNLVQPDCSVFGQKDAQQALILKRMIADLNVPVRMIVGPIVREADGLALSSRNTYLNPEERRAARILSLSLAEARTLIEAGERDAGRVLVRMRTLIEAEPTARIDYVEAVGPENLEPVSVLKNGTLIALAVWIGRTRLIDNLIVA
ncbi:MAG: pantoate--beta-alanine ligase [Acidobacteriota bacterium]|nr:pantoate--beta-alanine ligase [Acidobacteriota bacterium]OQB55348.1 MAG: Pantothenate synthetase [Candidatus Aminicenantes bacterium ADurb.Bin147]HNQ80690.1 pantoate--beta-alanine ligase [Candidatus Aminicenantes bacterium]MDD8010060.1 pantoate--beta-alanine ligase [Acidobacteriota bacterium]MDD8028281.1 pantoate--beta-alanine ligase [Acidobacteriota bacterium]